MPSFYFEQVLQTALNGIDQNVTGPVLQLAGVILILSSDAPVPFAQLGVAAAPN